MERQLYVHLNLEKKKYRKNNNNNNFMGLVDFFMPILSFGSQNIDLITGKQKMTIRKLWKKPLKKGDRLHCYWNLVSKERKKIFEATVTDVKLIEFSELIKNDKLAQEEGYRDAADMEKEFKKMYIEKIKDSDMFQIIYFEKLPVDKWEGEKINEKSMITQRADMLFDTGKYDKSAMCYTAALKIDPDDVYILNKKGDNLTRLGLFSEAIECYDKAIAIDPDNEYIWNNKAIALLNSGAPDKAIIASDKALENSGDNTVIYYWRAIILEMLQRFDEALYLYDLILDIDPSNHEVWNERGNLLTELGKAEDALESYEKALELCLKDDIDAESYNRKGNALLDLHRYQEALESYDQAIKMDSSNTIFWANKGVVLIELHKYDQALICFDRILNLDPDNEDALILKEECLDNL